MNDGTARETLIYLTSYTKEGRGFHNITETIAATKNGLRLDAAFGANAETKHIRTISPQPYLSKMFRSEDPEQKKLATRFKRETMKLCSALVAITKHKYATKEMERDIRYAKKLGIPILVADEADMDPEGAARLADKTARTLEGRNGRQTARNGPAN